jgi:thiosulfate/3-mercaptopyruvate sulfurtransferase
MSSTRALFPVVTSEEVRDLLGVPGTMLVDVRPLAAFNGWRLRGEARGGHIPKATAFPAAWLARASAPEVERLLGEKGLLAAERVLVSGYDPQDGAAVAERLRHLGAPDVRIHEGFMSWAADGELPVERLARHESLVHPAWLRALLAGAETEAQPAGPSLLFHVNFGVPEEYEDGHIPGALYLDTNRIEDPESWNRRTAEELDSTLRALGITTDTTVILYGRDTEGHANEKWPGRRAGQIAACRAAVILRYCGVDDVRVLDGGYDHWVQAGGTLETTVRQPTRVPAFGATIPRRPEVLVDIEEAKAILADRDGAALVSVRTWREHIGEVSGYNYIGPAGRIAGDVWGNCGTDAYHMQHYRNVDNTMRPYPEIAANWAAAGITPDKWVAFYCGTGWRAAETWFYAHLMGWPRIAVYDGGWFEWSRDPLSNPVETGIPNAIPVG